MASKAKPPTGTPKVQEVRPGRQTVSLYELGELGGYRYQIEIRWDTTYDFQSSASVSIWSPAAVTWLPVASLHYSLMRSRPHSRSSAAAFADDRAELLRRFAIVVCPS